MLNHWQCSGIASFISGQPTGVSFTTTVGTDITGSPTDGARIVMAGNPVLPKSERTFTRYFRTDVFRAPAVGTVGNAAKTVLRGPGINNWDIAVYKNFPASEKVRSIPMGIVQRVQSLAIQRAEYRRPLRPHGRPGKRAVRPTHHRPRRAPHAVRATSELLVSVSRI